MITSTQRELKRKEKHGKMHLISLIDQSTWLHFWTAKKKGKTLILVRGGASEQFVNLILDITLGPENPQNGKQFCFHVNVRNISSEDLSGESLRVIILITNVLKWTSIRFFTVICTMERSINSLLKIFKIINS